jgi:hypothetical protein
MQMYVRPAALKKVDYVEPLNRIVKGLLPIRFQNALDSGNVWPEMAKFIAI